MSKLRVRCLAGLLTAWLLAGAAGAATEDEYQAGVRAYNRGDVVAAMAAFRAPARAGHAPSQVFLAFILDRADFQDEAFALYRDAAAQDHPEGHAGLALAYQSGRGVAKDEKLALQHFSKAADLGHIKSIEIMAELHLKGDARVADLPAAAALAAVRRAADQHHIASVEGLAEAYRSGRWGLAADPAQAGQWTARAAELKLKRDGPRETKRSRR